MSKKNLLFLFSFSLFAAKDLAATELAVLDSSESVSVEIKRDNVSDIGAQNLNSRQQQSPNREKAETDEQIKGNRLLVTATRNEKLDTDLPMSVHSVGEDEHLSYALITKSEGWAYAAALSDVNLGLGFSGCWLL